MFGKAKFERLLIASIILALSVRIGIIVNTYGYSPHSDYEIVESTLAKNLVEGHGLSYQGDILPIWLQYIRDGKKVIGPPDIPTAPDAEFTPWHVLPPGEALLLAGTYSLFGEYKNIYAQVIQVIIDSFGCLLIFLIGKELFNRKIGLISAFLYAIWLPIAALAGAVVHDALTPFLLLLSFYFFTKGVKSNSVMFYSLSAFFIGVCAYFQATVLFLPLFLGMAIYLYNFKEWDFRKNAINTVKLTAIMMAVVVLVISPYVIRNYYRTGYLIVMRCPVWAGIWQGFAEFGENPVGASADERLVYQQAREQLGYDVKDWSPEADEYYRPKVLAAIEEHPGWWLSLVVRRIPKTIVTIVYHTDLGIDIYPKDAEGNLMQEEFKRQNPGLGRFKAAVERGAILDFIKSHPYFIVCQGLEFLFGILPIILSAIAIWLLRRNWRPLVLVLILWLNFSVVHIFTFALTTKSLIVGSISWIILSAVAIYYIYTYYHQKIGRHVSSQTEH